MGRHSARARIPAIQLRQSPLFAFFQGYAQQIKSSLDVTRRQNPPPKNRPIFRIQPKILELIRSAKQKNLCRPRRSNQPARALVSDQKRKKQIRKRDHYGNTLIAFPSPGSLLRIPCRAGALLGWSTRRSSLQWLRRAHNREETFGDFSSSFFPIKEKLDVIFWLCRKKKGEKRREKSVNQRGESRGQIAVPQTTYQSKNVRRKPDQVHLICTTVSDPRNLLLRVSGGGGSIQGNQTYVRHSLRLQYKRWRAATYPTIPISPRWTSGLLQVLPLRPSLRRRTASSISHNSSSSNIRPISLITIITIRLSSNCAIPPIWSTQPV